MPRRPPKLRDLPEGVYRASSGHLRHSRSPHRGQYVHRVVFLSCLKETPYSIQLMVPFPFEVHHMDYNKENNHPGNLLALDISLHSYQTVDGARRRLDGRFVPKFKGPEPWMPLFDDVVPF